MAGTRNGTIGLPALRHVAKDTRFAIVHAQILDQHMVANTAGDWDEIMNQGDVIHNAG